jgi:uncharacterized protein YndB with AHSA1/START domain
LAPPFRYDRSFEFDVAPRDLWSVLTQTDRYPEWWPWLRDFDRAEIEAGAVASCVVQGPLPYTLRFEVVVESVVPEERVATQVRGDLSGPAVLELTERPGGSSARLQWSLELRDRLLRPLSRVARPAMVWAHDRVIEIGLREFERVALNGDGRAR